jgi:hypothetical protein
MPHDQKPTKIWMSSLALVCFIAVATMLVGIWRLFATKEFTWLGFFFGLVLGTPAAALAVSITVPLFFTTNALLRRANFSQKKRALLAVTPSITLSAIVFVWLLIAAGARGRFRSEVISPVPSSIRDIRTAGFRTFGAVRWLFRFNSDTNDLQNILVRHHLAEAEPFNLKEILQHDHFLRKIEWISSVPETNQCRFFKRRKEDGSTITSMFLMYDQATSQVWFVQSYQN